MLFQQMTATFSAAVKMQIFFHPQKVCSEQFNFLVFKFQTILVRFFAFSKFCWKCNKSFHWNICFCKFRSV